MKAKEFIPQSRPRNFVAKNQKTAGAGAHKDKKRAEKQGDVKHKQKQFEQGVAEAVQNMIDEDINQNLVYHSVPNGQIAARIIKSGHLRLNEPFDFDRDYGGETRNAMSVSRDQYFRYGEGVVQFVLDKDALKRAGWKVVPKVGVGVGYKSEREERVYHSKNAPVPVKQPLVIAIQYDPKLKLPPAFKQSVASLDIPLVPMRSSKPQADTSTEPKQPKPASKYTDPNALELKSQDWFGEIAWTITYTNPDGSGSFIHPYYLAKDETMVKKAYAAIKDRIAKGLSFDDLLPKDQFGRTFKAGTYSIKPGEKGYKSEKGVAEGWDDEDEVEKFTLVKSLQWPELVNKVNSAMKAMGWKGQRKDDGSFMFSTRGQLDDEWYIVVIDNRGNNMFTYALGTVEEGDPHIGEQESLPMTEASVSELMDAIREGFSLNEHRVTEGSLNELSSELLGRYKKGASASATAADKAGDYAKGNKRFSGIVKATKKQFTNDSKDKK
jgi:hypothetical protein